jgi:hypothetical protein
VYKLLKQISNNVKEWKTVTFTYIEENAFLSILWKIMKHNKHKLTTILMKIRQPNT